MAGHLDEALSHDYAADDKWKAYLESKEFLTQPTPQQIEKLKRKYYQLHVNPNYQPPAGTSAPRSEPEPARSKPADTSRPQPKSAEAPRTEIPRGDASWGPRDFGSFKRYVSANRLRSAWFMTHAFFLIQSVWCTVPFIGGGDLAYRRAFKAAFLSFLIPLFAAHGSPKLNRDYLESLLRDSNGQYLVYTIIFTLADPPFFPALVPLAAYSVYHTSDLLRRDVIPALYPHAGRGRVAWRGEAALDNARGQVTAWAAQLEVYIFAALLALGIAGLLGLTRASILPVVMYYQFVRVRYLLNADTRNVVDRIVAHPRCPAFVRQAITWALRPQ